MTRAVLAGALMIVVLAGGFAVGAVNTLARQFIDGDDYDFDFE